MRIHVNGQPYEIPTSWDEVTFAQFLRIAQTTTDSERLAAITGLDAETIRNARIKNLDKVLRLLSFMNSAEGETGLPKRILGYEVPDNLELEQTGRYEDIKLIISTFPQDGKLSTESLTKYTEICGAIFQPDYLESDDKKKAEFAKKFLNAPCLEVMAIGNFTLMKLIELNLNTAKPFPKSNTLLRRFRLALIVWLRRSAFSLRFYLWKRRAGLTGMRY